MVCRPFSTVLDVSSSGTVTRSRTQPITSAGRIGCGSVVRRASRICGKYLVKRLLLASTIRPYTFQWNHHDGGDYSWTRSNTLSATFGRFSPVQTFAYGTRYP